MCDTKIYKIIDGLIIFLSNITNFLSDNFEPTPRVPNLREKERLFHNVYGQSSGHLLESDRNIKLIIAITIRVNWINNIKLINNLSRRTLYVKIWKLFDTKCKKN